MTEDVRREKRRVTEQKESTMTNRRYVHRTAPSGDGVDLAYSNLLSDLGIGHVWMFP